MIGEEVDVMCTKCTYDLKQGTWHYNYKFSRALVQSEEWCN